MALNTESPRPHDPEFTNYWNMFLNDIEDRANLKQSHLWQLTVLCDMAVEYEYLRNVLDVKGRTYSSEGRNGTQIKPRPELAQINKVYGEIRNYSKLFNIVLHKDQTVTKKGPKNEFDDDE